MKIYENLLEKPIGNAAIVVGPVEIFLPLSELINIEEEKSRLEKALGEIEGQIIRLEKLLASPFAEKAPANVVQKERDKLNGYRDSADKLKTQLTGLG